MTPLERLYDYIDQKKYLNRLFAANIFETHIGVSGEKIAIFNCHNPNLPKFQFGLSK